MVMLRVVDSEPDNGLWFRHQSPSYYDTLEPQTYASLFNTRNSGYKVKERYMYEKEYKKLLGNYPITVSFLYATIVGHNMMLAPFDYVGYTYYFRLSKEQISNCIFDVVDEKVWMEPTRGVGGLKKAIKIWDTKKKSFAVYDEDGVGVVDPRVEVVMPFSVKPEFYVPQTEDRH